MPNAEIASNVSSRRGVADRGDREDADDHRRCAQHDDCQRLTGHSRGDLAAAEDRLLMAAHLGDDGEQEHGDRGDLQAARRAAGTPTDHHQAEVDREGLVGDQGIVDRVEPSRAREHRPTQRTQELPHRTLTAEGGRVGPLESGEGREPEHEEDHRAVQGQAQVHRPEGGQVPAHALDDLEVDREAEATQHDGQADRHHDEGVGVEPHQIVGVERESGVVERRHRVEHAVVGRRSPVREVGPEPERQHDREHELERQ